METIITNWTLYVVLFFMLLGAYFLGFYFGNNNNNKKKKKENKVLINKTTKTKNAKNLKSDQNDAPSIEDFTPGIIRATKTRERAGMLINDTSTQEDKAMKTATITETQPEEKDVFVTNDQIKGTDDLTKIVGINNEIEKKLHDYGIHTYSQISKMSSDEIRRLSKQIDIFPGRIHRDDWKGQAEKLLQRVRMN